MIDWEEVKKAEREYFLAAKERRRLGIPYKEARRRKEIAEDKAWAAYAKYVGLRDKLRKERGISY